MRQIEKCDGGKSAGDDGGSGGNASSNAKPQWERCKFEFRAKLNCAKWLSASTMENSILNNNEKYFPFAKRTCGHTNTTQHTHTSLRVIHWVMKNQSHII